MLIRKNEKSEEGNKSVVDWAGMYPQSLEAKYWDTFPPSWTTRDKTKRYFVSEVLPVFIKAFRDVAASSV